MGFTDIPYGALGFSTDVFKKACSFPGFSPTHPLSRSVGRVGENSRNEVVKKEDYVG